MTKTANGFAWRSVPWGLAALGIAILAPTGALAADQGEPLSLGNAVQQALAKHPAIMGWDEKLAAARARRDQLDQATPWNLDLEVENVAGSGQYTGFDSVEATVGVFKLVERGDKRQLRSSVGDTGIDLNAARQEAVRIAVAADVASAFFAALAQQSRTELARNSLALAERTRDTVARRLEVGRSAEAELATADIGLARARYAASRAGNDLTVSRSQLTVLMGEESSAFGELRGDLFELPRLADQQNLRQRLVGNPELRQLAAQQTVLTAQRQLAESAARADLTVGASVRRLAQTDDTALVFSVNLPLGQRRRAAPDVAYARAQERAAPREAQARRLQLLADLYQLSGDLALTAEELGVVRQEIIPVAERAVELYQAGYERGRYALFELIDAQRTLLLAHQDAINAAERYQRLAIDIHRLVGEMPVEGATP